MNDVQFSEVKGLVSLIIPAYNSEDYIGDCLASAVAQEIVDLEIIVVNDGSTDKTLGIINSWAAKDSRINVINQANSGSPARARNRGLQEARGEFVAFMDSDDLMHSSKLQVLLNVFRAHPDLSIVFSDMVFFKESPDAEDNVVYLRDANFIRRAQPYFLAPIKNGYLCANNFYNFISTEITTLSTLNIMIKRQRLMEEKVWFPEYLLIGEDIDLWFRLAKSGQVAFIDKSLSYYRVRSDSISHQSQEKFLLGSLAAHGANYKRGKALFSPKEKKRLRSRLASQSFSLGYLYSKSFKANAARHAFVQALMYEVRWIIILAYVKTWFLKFIYSPPEVNDEGSK